MKKDWSNDIVGISTQDIYQHPDNPRKDLGDLTELSDSIKKNGVMQNCTVIPGHWDNERAWHEEGFTLIIGHRRFAAAKLAGVPELPCRIVDDMDIKDQVSTMLEENMQRNDLTIWEQANGFQMMLDLGQTEDQIAEKSGFSKTTVRRRLNIAKLDQKVLQQKEKDDSFQLTLKDLYELEKIEDIETRNKILREANSSRDIISKAQYAAEEAKRDKRAEAITKLLDEAKIEPAPKKYTDEMYTGKWETVKEYSLEKDAPDSLKISKKEKERKLYYVRYFRTIRIVALAEKREKTPEEIKQKEIEQKKKRIRDIMKNMDKRKHEFIQNIISGKIPPIKEDEDLRKAMWNTIVETTALVSASSMRKFFTRKIDYDCTAEEKAEANKKIAELSVCFQMLITMSYTLESLYEVYTYLLKCNHERCEKIKKAYAILERYGWTFTDEEKKILDGTHELYVQDEKEGE